jgi:RimJ/RimL family protein N-acetyltransferase
VAPVLEGTKVRLRPLTKGDLPTLIRWYADPEVNHWLHQSEYRDVSDERVRAKFGPGSERGDVRWLIETTEGTEIGLLRLEGIEWRHGRAELAVLIGQEDYRSRGYGTEAIGLALACAFGELGLRLVYLITDADNARGIRCYEKCGFRREGEMRGHRLRYGEPLDMVMMAVLKDDWAEEAGRRK